MTIPPALPVPIVLPPLFEVTGLAVFALTGALAAARLRQTAVTLAFFALVTGVGGGTLRDLLIGAPVFWLRDTWAAPVCLAVAALVWFTPVRWWEGKLLEWADAAGLAVYSAFGAIKALAWGAEPVPALAMGVVTGCFGGILRDVLAGRPSILMRPELYVTAAALAAGIGVLASYTSLTPGWALLIAALPAFALRGAAIHYAIALPPYASDRTDEDTKA